MITCLTLEQEALITVIRNKWRKIALDTSPTDKEKAETAINNLYKSANLKPPEKIMWFDNPLDGYFWLGENYRYWDIPSNQTVRFNYFSNFEKPNIIAKDLHETIQQEIHNNYYRFFAETIDRYISLFLKDYLTDDEIFYVQELLEDCYLIELYNFAILCNYYDAIRIKYSGEWHLWEKIAQFCCCSLFFTFSNLAVVAPKASIIKLDSNCRLHAEGQPALKYEKESMVTGKIFKMYAYHGYILPQKYGSVSPENWQAKWLSKEIDARLRWILAKEIGYDKLSQEFPVAEIRTWDNSTFFSKCTLLKVKSDWWGIFFIKIIFSSIDKINLCLLPHYVTAIRQAELWVKTTINSESNLSRLLHQANT